MKIAGIIAEYNPMHSGHAYQIAQTRQALGEGCAVVCCMSGNWTQGAGRAVADKWVRARLAVLGGADLVVELPTLWAVSSAEAFAFGGVSLLADTGVVTHLSFGSECGDLAALSAVADCLDSSVYAAGLRRFLDEGMPFAACRQAVVTGLLGGTRGELLASPNNNLGIEYLRALRRKHSAIIPMTVPRRGSGHGQAGGAAEFVSATQLRRWLDAGDWDAAEPYLIRGGKALLQNAPRPVETAAYERMVLSRLRGMRADDWAQLPDSARLEGLPERLERAGRLACSLPEFYELAKTKRYPHARLRRLALWAFLGLQRDDRPEKPPYIRVLAANQRGRDVLKTMKQAAALPILTKPAHVRALDGACRRVFETESRCTDLYGLCLPEIPAGGREWTEGPAIL